VSGLPPRTPALQREPRPLQTRVRSGSGAEHLSLAREDNSPDHNAKGTQSPSTIPKDHTRLPPLVGTWFQVLFHSPPGVLFTFPSRYSCTIGRGRVFSLGGWSPQIQPGLLEPRPTRVPVPPPAARSACRALTSYGGSFQTASARIRQETGYAPHRPHNPAGLNDLRFGLLPFRSPLLRESRLISLPPGTEMFQFPGLAS